SCSPAVCRPPNSWSLLSCHLTRCCHFSDTPAILPVTLVRLDELVRGPRHGLWYTLPASTVPWYGYCTFVCRCRHTCRQTQKGQRTYGAASPYYARAPGVGSRPDVSGSR